MEQNNTATKELKKENRNCSNKTHFIRDKSYLKKAQDLKCDLSLSSDDTRQGLCISLNVLRNKRSPDMHLKGSAY